MADGLSAPPTVAPTVKAEGAVASRRWCSECGALPTSQVRPKVLTLFGSQIVYSLPCSVIGCPGEVRMTRGEFQALHVAGVVAETPFDLLAMRKIQNQALLIMDDEEEDAQSKVQAGKLALSVSKERLRMSGLVPREGEGAGVTVNVQQTVVEPGDSLDRRLTRMYEASRDGRTISVETLVRPAAEGVPPSSVDDDFGFA